MIPYWKQSIDNDDIQAVIQALQSPHLTTWPLIQEFEKDLCDYTGWIYCAVCWNGTQALHLAYIAIGLREGDEVITTPISFVATTNMMLLTWAVPVFCDIKMDDYNIDEEKIESLITERTKAISVVHFAGRPCNMNKIWDIAAKFNLKVIEDGAHALGSEYYGKRIWNTRSDVVTFSFHPVKPITTGEWGAVMTNNKQYHDIMMKYRSHGIERDENGFNNMVAFWNNYRITDIQCALWISQLKRIDTFLNSRKNIVWFYKKYLSGNLQLILPKDDNIAVSWWHLYVIRLQDKKTRDWLMNHLKQAWYGVTLHYPPIYAHTYYRNHWFWDLSLPNAEKYFETCLSLPIYFGLDEEEIKKISSLIHHFINEF